MIIVPRTAKPRIGVSAKTARRTIATIARQNRAKKMRESLICGVVALSLLIAELIPGYTSLNWLAQVPLQAITLPNSDAHSAHTDLPQAWHTPIACTLL
jgi:hypothetical protein